MVLSDEFGFPDGAMVPIRNRAIELCPTEYRAFKGYYAENHEAVFDGYPVGLWRKVDPDLDKWYFDAYIGIGLTFTKIPDEILQGTAWVVVTADLVRFPLEIGPIARKIHLAGPEKNLNALRTARDLHLEGLRFTLELSECLKPNEDTLAEIEAIRPDFAEGIKRAKEEIECNRWYRLSHELLAAAEAVDERKLHAEFREIMWDTVGVCKEERAQAAE